MRLFYTQKRSNLFVVLSCLTFLLMGAELAFFLIHYHASELVDSLAGSNLATQMFKPVILAPLLYYSLVLIAACFLWIFLIWFTTLSSAQLFQLSEKTCYYLAILIWLLSVGLLFALNAYYFPASFFSLPWLEWVSPGVNKLLSILLFAIFCAALILAYINLYFHTKYRLYGACFIVFLCALLALQGYQSRTAGALSTSKTEPNIIIIGLDSLRPDFLSLSGKSTVKTPHLDAFLREATFFTQAYTPLARTLPSWMSILTGQYPKHHNIRLNLSETNSPQAQMTLAKKLKSAGYYSVFATDEMRFSNITQNHGFDEIISAPADAAEFILAGLNDFPLTNLLLKLPIAPYLLPYNFGNRVANVTYEPNDFLKLLQLGLNDLPAAPIFLSVHLCLAHWPFTWARDGQPTTLTLSQRYAASVERLDAQFAALMKLLQQRGLLENAIVVVLSDHGITLGMPHDRSIARNKYRGDAQNLSLVKRYKLNTADEFTFDFQHDYSLETSYGQGTDILSLNQHKIVLAFRGFHVPLPAKKVAARVSILDVAPTLLSILKQSPLGKTDGHNLFPYMIGHAALDVLPFFMETADTIGEIETDKIHVEKVVQQLVGAYQLDPKTGLLSVNPATHASTLRQKQRAVYYKDWLLAYYPAKPSLKIFQSPNSHKFAIKQSNSPPYFVLLNVKTGLWTIGLRGAFARTAPSGELITQLTAFYGDEIALGTPP